MTNKQTAVQWILKELMNDDCLPDGFPFEIYNEALAMEKEQMIEFAQIGIDNTCGDYDGNVVLLKPIEEIYNETYKQQDK